MGAASAQGEDVALSRDPLGVAPYLQQFLRGLGGPLDTWSTSTTQYCQGIARRARNCSPADVFVTHPAGSLLAGVWADVDAPAPSSPTAADLGREAARAAEHFGNLDPLVNASAQYVVASAHGVRPDGFPAAGYCAWHDRTSGASVRVASTMGDLAFVNLPYVPDAGRGCGQGFVNGRSGDLDGVSLVAGHELAETITDPLPPAGWVDRQGAENADKCAWIRSGPGAAADVPFGSGVFPVQSLWSNDAVGGVGGCVLSYAGPADER